MNLPPPAPIGSQPEPPPIRADVVRVPVRLPATKPTVTTLIMGITIAIYLLQLASQQFLGSDYPAMFGMKINSAIRAGEYWRLLTPMLLHGGILHISFNMYALYSLGRSVERTWGHARFLALYLLSALAGNTLSFLLSPNPSLGASTAVFGLIAAEGVTIYLNRKNLGGRYKEALGNIVFLIGANLLLGFSMAGIDNFGHMGGLLGGAVYALLAGPKFTLEGFYPDLRLVDARQGLLPWLVAALEAIAILLVAFLSL